MDAYRLISQASRWRQTAVRQLGLWIRCLRGTSAGGQPPTLGALPTSLAHLFDVAPDDAAVWSVCAVPHSDGWQLLHGSLLFVPAECAQLSWPDWSASQGDRLGAENTPSLPPELVLDGEGWLLGRVVLTADEVTRLWETITGTVVADQLTELQLPVLGAMPPMLAKLSAPNMLMRVFRHIDSRASSLITGLYRPADALLFEGDPELAFAEPDRVEVSGGTLFSPARELAGIHVTPDYVKPEIATAAGLLVGRAERRAWIADSHGDGTYEHYVAQLRWDPIHIDLDDLELTHVERHRRDTVLSARMQLADLDASEVADLGVCEVNMPTLGRSVTHEVLLHDLSGELLDRSGPYPIVERMIMTMKINGASAPPVTIGATDPPPELEHRLTRRDQIASELEDILHNAAQARILADRQTALDRLTKMLSRARGELLVADRYFGQSLNDWQILDDVPGPVRVLTGKLEADANKQIVPVPLRPAIQARYRPKAPIHERIYLWDGGGLSLGGSPTTLGQSPVRLARMSPAEVDLWRAQFETMWASPHFNEVPRV